MRAKWTRRGHRRLRAAPDSRDNRRVTVPPRVIRIVLLVAIVLGVAVDTFFAIVNFYPVAPHPKPGPKRYVVMQLDETQAAWFKTNILDEFNAETNSNLDLLRVDDEEQLQAVTLDAAKQGKEVVLTALPVTQTGHAIDTKLVQPFAGAIPASDITHDFGDLGASVLASGKVGATQYFLPRMAVIDVAVYRVSKVRDACCTGRCCARRSMPPSARSTATACPSASSSASPRATGPATTCSSSATTGRIAATAVSRRVPASRTARATRSTASATSSRRSIAWARPTRRSAPTTRAPPRTTSSGRRSRARRTSTTPACTSRPRSTTKPCWRASRKATCSSRRST